MLAMDVVDTLRHAERLVERELSGDDRRDALRRRLKEIYAGQGIEVPDRIIDQGVAALEENRFVYRPTAPSLSRGLARIYATRDSWGRLIGLCLAGLLVLGSGYWFGVKLPHEKRVAAERVELAEGLPKALQAARDRVLAATQVPEIRAQADRLLAEGRAAAAAGALTDGRTRLAAQKATLARQDLEQKGKPYLADPLFAYLWRRGWGTDTYRASPIIRLLDRWPARAAIRVRAGTPGKAARRPRRAAGDRPEAARRPATFLHRAGFRRHHPEVVKPC